MTESGESSEKMAAHAIAVEAVDRITERNRRLAEAAQTVVSNDEAAEMATANEVELERLRGAIERLGAAEPGLLDRVGWLDEAIPRTREFCDEVDRDHEMERKFARFASADYDYEIDLKHSADMARDTLRLMESERQSILASREMRRQKRLREESE